MNVNVTPARGEAFDYSQFLNLSTPAEPSARQTPANAPASNMGFAQQSSPSKGAYRGTDLFTGQSEQYPTAPSGFTLKASAIPSSTINARREAVRRSNSGMSSTVAEMQGLAPFQPTEFNGQSTPRDKEAFNMTTTGATPTRATSQGHSRPTPKQRSVTGLGTPSTVGRKRQRNATLAPPASPSQAVGSPSAPRRVRTDPTASSLTTHAPLERSMSINMLQVPALSHRNVSSSSAMTAATTASFDTIGEMHSPIMPYASSMPLSAPLHMDHSEHGPYFTNKDGATMMFASPEIVQEGTGGRYEDYEHIHKSLRLQTASTGFSQSAPPTGLIPGSGIFATQQQAPPMPHRADTASTASIYTPMIAPSGFVPSLHSDPKSAPGLMMPYSSSFDNVTSTYPPTGMVPTYPLPPSFQPNVGHIQQWAQDTASTMTLHGGFRHPLPPPGVPMPPAMQRHVTNPESTFTLGQRPTMQRAVSANSFPSFPSASPIAVTFNQGGLMGPYGQPATMQPQAIRGWVPPPSSLYAFPEESASQVGEAVAMQPSTSQMEATSGGISPTTPKKKRYPPVGRPMKPGPKPKNKTPKGKGKEDPDAPPSDAAEPMGPTFNLPISAQLQASYTLPPHVGLGLLGPEARHHPYASGAVDTAAVERPALPREYLESLYGQVLTTEGSLDGRPVRRYVCRINNCDRQFPRKSAVVAHVQTHLEDKPYACTEDDCGAAFVRQHDLRRHMKIHTGQKSHKCPCGKKFARGDALMRHRQRNICEGSLNGKGAPDAGKTQGMDMDDDEELSPELPSSRLGTQPTVLGPHPDMGDMGGMDSVAGPIRRTPRRGIRA